MRFRRGLFFALQRETGRWSVGDGGLHGRRSDVRGDDVVALLYHDRAFRLHLARKSRRAQIATDRRIPKDEQMRFVILDMRKVEDRDRESTYVVSAGGGMNIGVILRLPSEVLVSICLLIGPLTGVVVVMLVGGGTLGVDGT